MFTVKTPAPLEPALGLPAGRGVLAASAVSCRLAMFDPDAAVQRVCVALANATLRRGDLTARRLTAFLGQSTMALYHHFGSLDGMLIRVDGAGWKRLLAELHARVADGGSAADMATAYLDFAFKHPELYWLMSEYPFDRAALREKNRLRQGRALWGAFVELVRRVGSRDAEGDTRILMAGLHGLVALTSSGRGDLAGTSQKREREACRESALRLVSALLASERATLVLPD